MEGSVPSAGPLPGLPAVVHADADCIAVDKPSGLLSVPGRGPDKQDCLATRVQAIYPDARVVHRLDQGTSGVWLMARGPAMQKALGAAFERREVSKRYVALVAGRLTAPDSPDGWGQIDLPLAPDWPRRPLQKVDPEAGRPSQTRWRVLDTGARCTRVELEPLTGRSHQLRVHLMALGHPILGDTLYAPPEVQAMAPRLMLHASELSLVHPGTRQVLRLAAPVPF